MVRPRKGLSQRQKDRLWFDKFHEEEAFHFMDRSLTDKQVKRLMKKMPSWKFNKNELGAITELAWSMWFREKGFDNISKLKRVM